jgi:hypothetical protein
VGAALLFPLVQEQTDRGRELSEQLTTLGQYQQRVAEVKGRLTENRDLEKRIEETLALTAALRSERNTIRSTGGEVSSDVRRVLYSLSAEVLYRLSAEIFLGSISVKEESILVEGEASDHAAALAYAKVLEESGQFPTVAIVTVSLKEPQTDTAVTFALSLARKHVAPS